MYPNLRALETLLAIARLGSFVAAARQLNTAQPTVSMRIRELERQLGVRLIERDHAHVRLTSRGQKCAQYAEYILALSTQLHHDVANPEAYTGRIRIGVSESVALTWLPRLVRRVHDDYRNVTLEIDVDLTATLWRKLSEAAYDLIMVPGRLLSSDAYAEPLGRLASVWMASPSLKIPGKILSAHDLERWPIVTLSKEANLARVVEHWFHRAHARPKIVNWCNSLHTIASLTVAGVGISLLPPVIFDEELRKKKLVILKTHPAVKPIQYWSAYAAHGDRLLPRAITDLAKAITTFDR